MSDFDVTGLERVRAINQEQLDYWTKQHTRTRSRASLGNMQLYQGKVAAFDLAIEILRGPGSTGPEEPTV